MPANMFDVPIIPNQVPNKRHQRALYNIVLQDKGPVKQTKRSNTPPMRVTGTQLEMKTREPEGPLARSKLHHVV